MTTQPATKEFTTAAVATLSTGVAMVAWGEAAALAEWIIGHPIWTHEYPAMADSLSAAVQEQFPGMPTEARSGPAYLEDLASIEAKFGKTLVVRRGSAVRTQDPLATLVEAAGGAKEIVVVSS